MPRPGVPRRARATSGGPAVQGKAVTGFANTGERSVELTLVVPFLVEDMLKANGGIYSSAADWQPHVVVDGLLISGQNPASSEPAARALQKKLARPADGRRRRRRPHC